MTNNVIKSKKRNFDILAATDEAPENPKSPATIEIARKTNAQYSIVLPLLYACENIHIIKSKVNGTPNNHAMTYFNIFTPPYR
ncbi:MAG: hypothetical protein BGO43_14325 [Gammaproteobacteria bacterium 39-13]|nr:MAG: hypothetical protein BGO43_14325 [Gammaproteobacteria bacterium 39-13]